MSVVTDPRQVRALLSVLRARSVALACFCTENSWTTEAILQSAAIAAERMGLKAAPVSVAFTASYPQRSHLRNYWAGGELALGFRSVMTDIRTLAGEGGPYEASMALPHLDHGQPDGDRGLLEEHADEFAMVMFDGGGLPFDVNIERTAAYVERFRDRVVIEGALLELKESSQGGAAPELSTPAQAQRFLDATGCDLIVPNVGTEHRAAAAGMARYDRRRARQISRAVGSRLVLHGTSSLSSSEVASLAEDGFIKVNVWTAIERVGSDSIVRYALENLGHILRRDQMDELAESGLIGPEMVSEDYVRARFGGEIAPRLTHFPLYEFRKRWVDAVVSLLLPYFEAFGYRRLAGAL